LNSTWIAYALIPSFFNRVAVVSDSYDKAALSLLAFSAEKVNPFGFEDDNYMWDLCKDWLLPACPHVRGVYDLFLCEQVLEHVFEPRSVSHIDPRPPSPQTP